LVLEARQHALHVRSDTVRDRVAPPCLDTLTEVQFRVQR
jgi:hypothetical protein